MSWNSFWWFSLLKEEEEANDDHFSVCVCQFPFLLSCLCFRWEEIVGQWEENSAPPPPLPPPSPSPSSTAGGRIDASVPAGMSPVFLSAFPPSCPSDPGSYFRDRIDSGIANSSPPLLLLQTNKHNFLWLLFLLFNVSVLIWLRVCFRLNRKQGEAGGDGNLKWIRSNCNQNECELIKLKNKEQEGGRRRSLFPGRIFSSGRNLQSGVASVVPRNTHTHTHININI